MSFLRIQFFVQSPAPLKAFLQIDSVRSPFGLPLAVYLRLDSVNFV